MACSSPSFLRRVHRQRVSLGSHKINSRSPFLNRILISNPDTRSHTARCPFPMKTVQRPLRVFPRDPWVEIEVKARAYIRSDEQLLVNPEVCSENGRYRPSPNLSPPEYP